MRMKRAGLVLAALLVILAACSHGETGGIDSEEGKIKVVTTFFPLYDFAVTIGGEHVHVINIVPAGVDPHDWSPGSKEMKSLSSADLFLYNGAGLEGWAEAFIRTLDDRSGPYVQAAIEGVPLIEPGDHHDHDGKEHGRAASSHDHHHGRYDPHAWLSPLQAMKYAENVKGALIAVDPENRQAYEKNYANLAAQLEQLHQDYAAMARSASSKHLVVTHEALGYLARDYGLQQHAVMGLSADAEPTRKEISEISKFIRNNDVKFILFEQFISPRMAEVLAKDLNIEAKVFHSLEGITKEQEARGETYIRLMRENLNIFQSVLE